MSPLSPLKTAETIRGDLVRELAAALWRRNRAQLLAHHLLATKIQSLMEQDPQSDPILHHLAAKDDLLANSPTFRQLTRVFHRTLAALRALSKFPNPIPLINAPVLIRPRPIRTNEPNRPTQPPSRNSLCPCNSGKRHKRCCAGLTGQQSGVGRQPAGGGI